MKQETGILFYKTFHKIKKSEKIIIRTRNQQ